MKYFNDPSILISETAAIDRFLKYVTFETTSNPASQKSPSSQGQLTLGTHLVAELKSLGLTDAALDTNGYVTASKMGSGDVTIGLIAHLDTSDAFTGRNVFPVVHKSYEGNDILLKNAVVITPQNDSHLRHCIGHTIITADGTTLLGADDKAGIAIIMGVLEYMNQHSNVTFPSIRICFTPDEEIGRGADKFPIKSFNADFALTIDGTFAGEINLETFEAYSMDVTFKGVSVHPGYAKNKMVNALRHMADFLQALPMAQSPERTENKEGFIHPVSVSGDASECSVHLIVRDFTEAGAKKRCETVEQILNRLKKKENRLDINSTIHFNYPNMFNYIQKHEELVTNLKLAVNRAGISPEIVPIRGGTDGANLSKKGLVTPNLFTGAVNLHGPNEWVSTTNMGYSFCTILNLLELYSSTARRRTNG